jgi:hypothetical protein
MRVSRDAAIGECIGGGNNLRTVRAVETIPS